MRKRTLRCLLGLGYVLLLSTLLLYQTGALGRRREWEVAVLGTLFLGVALAVVLMLYLRVRDQVKRQEESRGTKSAPGQEEGKKDPAGPIYADSQNLSAGNRSYEEIYASFLAVMESCALSERELEVSWLLFRGYTNRQIGEALYIAETTVKKHVSHIYQKMDVQSRKEFRTCVQAAVVSIPAVSQVPSQTDPRG
ncbi:MAG: LuxR C-terminal-related transcriptional regulator [Lachnospiraceae bacterium]|nr:LuxR C-terminal-related transcriptional regulator [Lachnospiraceae bacterium]